MRMLDKIQIKVCGITDINQALALEALGVEYIGFIFYAPSKRYVLNSLQLTALKKFTPAHAKKVGVFVSLLLFHPCHWVQCRHLKNKVSQWYSLLVIPN